MSTGAGDALAAMTDFSPLNSTEHGYPEGPSVMSQGCAGKSSGVNLLTTSLHGFALRIHALLPYDSSHSIHYILCSEKGCSVM